MDMRAVNNMKPNPVIPNLAPGDTVKISFKTVEGEKERVQHFQGVVIRIRRGIPGGSFTLRRSTFGVGVERTFFFHSPAISKVEVLRHGKVRRAKLYYLRRLSAKEARLKERQEVLAEKLAAQTASAGVSAAPTSEAAPSPAPAPSAETPAAPGASASGPQTGAAAQPDK